MPFQVNKNIVEVMFSCSFIYYCLTGFDDSIIVNTEPPSGSQLVGLDGTSNFITLNCSVYHGNDKEIVWSVQNFRSWATVKRVNYDVAPGLFYVSKETNQSHFTIQNLTSEFDGVTVFCGTEEEHKLANFTFKLYRKNRILLVPCTLYKRSLV